MTPTLFLAVLLSISPILLTPTLAQEPTRNLVYPTTASSTPAAATPTPSGSLSGVNSLPSGTVTNGTLRVNGTSVNGTAVNATAAHPPTTSSVSLSRIADATGVVNVPVPVMTGQRANGRFGPDDGYIAAVGRLIIPISFSVGLVAVTMFIVVHGL